MATVPPIERIRTGEGERERELVCYEILEMALLWPGLQSISVSPAPRGDKALLDFQLWTATVIAFRIRVFVTIGYMNEPRERMGRYAYIQKYTDLYQR